MLNITKPIWFSINTKFLDNCDSLDETRYVENIYNHQPIDDGNAHEKNYFYISAPDFTKDLVIGFSNGYTGPSDDKWEIIGGGYYGREFGIKRIENGRARLLARYGRFPDTSVWERLRSNLAVQVRDGNVALYSANPDGTKADLLCEVNDPSIIKSDLNTLTVTGMRGGYGNAQIRGVCNRDLV